MRVTRFMLVAPWAASALALALSAPPSQAAPGRHRHVKSAAHCVRYKQKLDQQEMGVDLSLSNRCRFDVTCTLKWEVRCAGRKDARGGGAAFDLASGQSDSAYASASTCPGDWEVANVRWSCDPVEAEPPAQAP